MNLTSRKKTWLRIILHTLGWSPLIKLLLDFTTDNLTANPIQAAVQRLGRIAFYFLIASLSVTPLYILTGWRGILPHRRALGLYTFLYASLHLLIFAGLDYGFDFSEIFDLVATKPFILLGSLAFLLLLLLAITSFDYFQRRMKKNWKRLHRVVYLVALFVIVHFIWAQKGDLLKLRGNILQPLFFGLLLLVLFLFRLPPIRQRMGGWRQKIRRKRFTQEHAENP